MRVLRVSKDEVKDPEPLESEIEAAIADLDEGEKQAIGLASTLN